MMRYLLVRCAKHQSVRPALPKGKRQDRLRRRAPSRTGRRAGGLPDCRTRTGRARFSQCVAAARRWTWYGAACQPRMPRRRPRSARRSRPARNGLPVLLRLRRRRALPSRAGGTTAPAGCASAPAGTTTPIRWPCRRFSAAWWRSTRSAPGGAAARRPRFEICELGAGNGQLCLDTLLWVHECGRHDRAWKTFADAPALPHRRAHRRRWRRASASNSGRWRSRCAGAAATRPGAVPRGVPFARARRDRRQRGARLPAAPQGRGAARTARRRSCSSCRSWTGGRSTAPTWQR